jgi:phytoene dehydrogenase-like protein
MTAGGVMTTTFDAVVIGAGPNGLVAANALADQGWSVIVLEAQPEPGGAVRSSELEPGFVGDRFSAFYPLSIVSPHLRALELERYGLVWAHAPSVLAHPTIDGPAAMLDRDMSTTASSLDAFCPGDGAAWIALQEEWCDVEAELIDAFMGRFPPVRPAARLVRRLGVVGTGELARRALLPVEQLAAERFGGAGAGLLLAGSALHADVTPGTALSGLLGWLLCGIGQRHGWPVPQGGSSALTAALVARLEGQGGVVQCGAEVVAVMTDAAGACGVRTSDGTVVRARHAVLADVVAPKLYCDLVDHRALPSSAADRMARYEPGSATFKVNWTLDGPIPWTDPTVCRAGTVHLAASLDELTMSAAQLRTGRLPDRPFVLLGQMSTADPTRSPPGTETVWAYTDVPHRVRGDAAGQLAGLGRRRDVEQFADRIEDRIVEHAPGFRDVVRHRWIQTPADMERDDANLIGGDKNLGTARLHQQLVFRPMLGFSRPETPVPGLFLASASAHPGGGVHGACGANAARAAVLARRFAPVAGRWRTRRWRSRTSPATGAAVRAP